MAFLLADSFINLSDWMYSSTEIADPGAILQNDAILSTAAYSHCGDDHLPFPGLYDNDCANHTTDRHACNFTHPAIYHHSDYSKMPPDFSCASPREKL
jgi:hypothetical protein